MSPSNNVFNSSNCIDSIYTVLGETITIYDICTSTPHNNKSKDLIISCATLMIAFKNNIELMARCTCAHN